MELQMINSLSELMGLLDLDTTNPNPNPNPANKPDWAKYWTLNALIQKHLTEEIKLTDSKLYLVNYTGYDCENCVGKIHFCLMDQIFMISSGYSLGILEKNEQTLKMAKELLWVNWTNPNAWPDNLLFDILTHNNGYPHQVLMTDLLLGYLDNSRLGKLRNPSNSRSLLYMFRKCNLVDYERYMNRFLDAGCNPNERAPGNPHTPFYEFGLACSANLVSRCIREFGSNINEIGENRANIFIGIINPGSMESIENKRSRLSSPEVIHCIKTLFSLGLNTCIWDLNDKTSTDYLHEYSIILPGLLN